MAIDSVQRRILMTGIAGITGSLGMFAGDMLLYFTTAEYDASGGLMEYARLMADLPPARLIAGSALGPICALLYCVGFSQLLYAARVPWARFSKVLVALLCVSWVVGGAYHSQFGLMGIVIRYSTEAARAAVDYVTFFYMVTMGLFAVGALFLAVMLLAGGTWYPRWFVLLTPAVLIWLPLDLLPQPFRIVIMGGWTNLMFLPFFIVSTTLLRNRPESRRKR